MSRRSTMGKKKKKKERKTGGGHTLYAIVVLLLAIAIFVMSMLLLFHVQTIQIRGNKYVESSTVAKSIQSDKYATNTLYIMVKNALGKIKYPKSVESAKIRMKAPWSIQVTVKAVSYTHLDVYKRQVVDDRRIRCHKVGGHGSETFVEGVQNSCNPVFIDIGLRLGVDKFYKGFQDIGLMERTGVDIPGEAGTIMHKKSNIGPVELATMSFGQSFQITPIQLAATVSSIINGGERVTPHFGVKVTDEKGDVTEEFRYPVRKNVISEETSASMRTILESVVSEGSGKNAYISGYKIGGKTLSLKSKTTYLPFSPIQVCLTRTMPVSGELGKSR